MKKILLLGCLFIALLKLKAQSLSGKAFSQTVELQKEMLDSMSIRMNSAELVGLGEVSHGSSEIFIIKSQLVKFLIEKMNFRQILFELDDPTLRPLNEYLKDGSPRDKKQLDSIFDRDFNFAEGGIILNNQPFKELISWLKDFNVLHPDDVVELRGIDIFVPFKIFRHHYMDSASVHLMQKEYGIRNLSLKETDRLIQDWYLREKQALEAKLGDEAFSLVQMDVRNFRSQLNYYANGDAGNSKMVQFRDSVMYKNVVELKSTKSILWGHNLHIRAGDFIMNRFHAKMLGSFLKQAYDKKYFTILTDFVDRAKITTISKAGNFSTKVFNINNKTLSSKFVVQPKFFQLLVFDDDPIIKDMGRSMNNIGLFGDYFLLSGEKKSFDALILFKELSPVLTTLR